MKKKIFAGLATLAVGAMTAAGAMADGLPRGGSIKDAPPPPSRCAYFGGFFVGGHVAWNDYKTSRNDYDHFVSFTSTPAGYTEADDSFGGGLGVGYNFQTRGKCTMWGVEADFSWSRMRTTSVIDPNHIGAPGDDFRIRSTADWIATLRTRGGIVVDNTLLYLTGGIAFADINTLFRHNHIGGANEFTFSESQIGMVAGAGLEVALTERISLKSEVLYINFGDWRRTGTGSVAHFGAPPSNSFSFSGNDEVWSSRTAINVRF